MAFEGTVQIDYCGDCRTSGSCLGKLFSSCATGGGCSAITHVAAGHHLFRSGDAVACVFVLRSGALKTYVNSADGEEQILAFHSPGDVVGVEGIATGRHTRNTVALSRSEVCRVPIEALIQASGRNSALQASLLDSMGREIQRLQGMLRLERMTAEQRIAFFLINQARRQARGSSVDSRRVVQLAMSRGEIGRFLDLATETVSRCLTRLQNAGMIRISRNEIELLNVSAMQRLTQSGGGDDRRMAA
jgi:CRP/FNR family transcriptional regulator